MLKKVRRQNWNTDFAYAPPQEDAVINLDDVSSIVETTSRGSGPFVLVRFRDGNTMYCVGRPEDFVMPQDVDRLLRACKGIDHALESLLAVREGISDELLSSLLIELRNAMRGP